MTEISSYKLQYQHLRANSVKHALKKKKIFRETKKTKEKLEFVIKGKDKLRIINNELNRKRHTLVVRMPKKKNISP